MAVTPSRPVMVSLATRESMIASSVAWMTPANRGSRAWLGRKAQSRTPDPSAQAAVLAVEKAMKMSPEALWAIEPERPTPRPTRRARRLSWWGIRGASVATMAMIEPPGLARSSPPVMCLPTGTPAITNSERLPKLACTKAPTV